MTEVERQNRSRGERSNLFGLLNVLGIRTLWCFATFNGSVSTNKGLSVWTVSFRDPTIPPACQDLSERDMRDPNTPRSFADIIEEIEVVVLQLRHSTKRRERMTMLRELRILLKEMDIEVGYLVLPNVDPSNACFRN